MKNVISMIGRYARNALAGLAAVALVAVPLAYAANQSIDGYLRVAGKIWTGVTPPVLTSCGTTPAITGSDTAGIVTMGTGTPTGCIITFAAAYTAIPYCVVSWIATPLASQSYVTAAASITLTQTATSSNKVQYICFAQDGG